MTAGGKMGGISRLFIYTFQQPENQSKIKTMNPSLTSEAHIQPIGLAVFCIAVTDCRCSLF
jgi:hypothetical protein